MDREELEARLTMAADEAARVTTLTLAFFLNDHDHRAAAAFLLEHARESMSADDFAGAFKTAQRLRKQARTANPSQVGPDGQA